MRFWIVNPFDKLPGEGPTMRFGSLAYELASRGHEVVWWSSRWSHTHKRERQYADEAPSDKGAVERQSQGVRVELLPAPPYYRNVGFGRIRNHWVLGRRLREQGAKEIAAGHAPDLILASLPPVDTCPAAVYLARSCGARLVVDVMDAWPDNLRMALPAPLRGLGGILLTPYERAVSMALREADAVSAQSHTFAAFARAKGADQTHRVFYLGAPARDVIGTSKPSTSPFRLVYLGSMGLIYELDTLIRAIAALRSKGHGVELQIVGEGDNEAQLHQLSKKIGVQDLVNFHGYQHGKRLDEILGSAHAGVIPMSPESLVSVPYKAGDYLSAGLAVVTSLPGELAQLLEKFGCGVSYKFGDVDSLAGSIARLHSEYDDRVTENARKLFHAHFNQKSIYPAFADWLEGLAGAVQTGRV